MVIELTNNEFIDSFRVLRVSINKVAPNKILWILDTNIRKSEPFNTVEEAAQAFDNYVTVLNDAAEHDKSSHIDDATAVAEDILYGKTAYVNSGKVVGQYVPVDLSIATANAGDIRSGITAYTADGLVEGTLTVQDLPEYVSYNNVVDDILS